MVRNPELGARGDGRGPGHLGQRTEAAARRENALLGQLNADLDSARKGLDDVKVTNTAMRSLIDDAWNDTAEVARSHASALEKLRAVVARLEALQKSLGQGDRP